MKVAISTIIDYDNYGNRLQNYASQQVLKSLGCEVETIPEQRNLDLKKKIKIKILNCLLPFYKNSKKVDITRLNRRLREERFIKFTQKNIKNHNLNVTCFEDLQKLNDKFDYFVTGSDQVWNYCFRPHLDRDFLTFASQEKRIGYAPSFGVSTIPEEYREKYGVLISQMSCLSVREHAGAKIIKELTGRDAEVLIDPTLMLTKEEWSVIANKPKCMPKNKYLLTYVLGEKSNDFNQFIEKVAKEKGLEIFNMLNWENRDIHSIDPGEFVYLIDHAEVMITDSFHGAVFSIISKTPFVIFERKDDLTSMNSRIDTLVTTFKMEHCLSNKVKSVEDVFNIDFSHIDDILQIEKQRALNYLKKSLKLS